LGFCLLRGACHLYLNGGIEWEVDFGQKRKAGSSKLIDSFSGLL
jgi:hypothetical protein